MMMPNRGAFSTYRAELSGVEPLSAEVERDLALGWRNGDRRAGERLIEASLPLVVKIALEYRRWGVPLEDIVQEGNLGLLKGAARFDPDRGCRLATYAAYWIRAEIREYVVRGYRMVRLGTSKRERRALRAYRKTHERDASALARLSGLSEQRATALLPVLMAPDVSLDHKPIVGLAPIERFVAPQLTPEEEVCLTQERAWLGALLRTILDELPARERWIVRRRWMTETPLTLEQLGVVLGVSKERVRQLEQRAKRRIRERFDELTREPLPRSA